MSKCPEFCIYCTVRDVASSDWDRFSLSAKFPYLFSKTIYQMILGVYHKEKK